MENKQRCCCGDDDLLGGGGGELIHKILVRLPLKSLGRFKMVSKFWCTLIESPNFFIDDGHTINSSSPSSLKFGSFILLASHTKYLQYYPPVQTSSSLEHSLIMISSSSSSESESVDSVSRSSGSSGGCCCVWSNCLNHHDQEDELDQQLVFKVDIQQQQQHQQVVFKLDSLGFPEFEDFSKTVSDLGLPKAFKSAEFTKQIIGSCNGLVCVYDGILNEVSLWNPATRQFKILPRSIKIGKDDLPYRLVGFGFDVETKDYKVVLLTGFKSKNSYYRPNRLPIECKCQVQVYSLSTDSWKLLEGLTSLPGFPFSSYPGEVVSLNNNNNNNNGSCCFFLAHFFHTKQQRCVPENDRFIISFDFTKEIFTPMQLPDHHRHQKLYLRCLGGDDNNKMALFTVCCKCNPPHWGDSYDIYELPPPPPRSANYSCYSESYEPPGIDYCGCEDYNIWVLDEPSISSSSSVNKESWRRLHSFQIEHQRLGEWTLWTLPSCISNDGEFVLLETRNSTGLGKKMKLYNLVTKEVKKEFLSCSRVMSKAYAYKPSLVTLMVGSSSSRKSR